ncbi:alpha/beta hydrolase [Ramlibacter sp. PS4R-6]|uniref:alpha/beta hydrolase n=1 Tax=Ramlibacter sp. PS4R-6 TaxID=3133438 RepID=UPI00309F9FD6
MQTTQALTAFRAPSLGLLATEPLRAALDYCASRVASVPKPQGDGHPVIVYPGLGGGAITTSHLRRFLKDCNFSVHDWEGGVNTGPEGVFDDWLGSLEERVQQLHALHGRKVSLIGWSLGGVYARELAKRSPQSVRQVITLGTPFNALAHGNHAGTVFKILNRDRAHLPPDMQERISDCPPVPTTSVYSKSDGIVCWQGCIEKRGPASESVEVHASHLGMVTHPQVLRIIANRLAQPEGTWRPLKRRERLGRA